MPFDVLVTRSIPDEGLQLLRAGGAALRIHPMDGPMPRSEILDAVITADGVVCLLTDRIDAEVLDAAKRCVGIAVYAVGYENVDLAGATERGIMVTNTPGVLTEATADLAWALVLAVARRIIEGDSMVRQGRFEGWGPMLLLGFDLFGKTLGIVGAGRIGTAVARRARGFGMRLLYAGTCGKPEMDRLGASCVSLERLLEESDVVSLHVPLTPTTHHLIDAHALDRMKPTAFLINTSRGPVIDEAALVEALRSGRIAGAGLDVYEREPVLHPALCQLPNTVLLPHVGSATVETRGRMAAMAARSLLAMLRGESPPNLLNPQVIGRHRLAGRMHGR